MPDVQMNLNTVLDIGDQSIIVSISTDPNANILPVLLLWGTDSINQHEEFYVDVPTALARLAALVMCCQADWDSSPVGTPSDFTQRAHEFLTNSIEN